MGVRKMTARMLARGAVTGPGKLTYPLEWKLENAQRTHDRAVETLKLSIEELAGLEAKFDGSDTGAIFISTAKSIVKRNKIQLLLAEAKLLVAQSNWSRDQAWDALKEAHKRGEGIEAAEEALAVAEKMKKANAEHLYKLQRKYGV